MLFLTLALCLSSALAAVDYTGHRVLRVVPQNERDVTYLTELMSDYDFWKDPSAVGRPVDIRTSPEQFSKLKVSLRSRRIQFEILHEDVQKLIDASLVRSNVPRANDTNDDFRDYKTLAEVEEFVARKVSECGARCTLNVIGQSYEGRPLNVIKISTGTGRRALWVDAGIHAREWIAWSTGMYFVAMFVDDYDTDQEIQAILNEYDVYILPGQNPDGYEYTWTDDRLWRKSRSPNTPNPCFGTDINRNFDFQWCSIGASNNPCDQTFCGPSAQSESEANHVANFVSGMDGQWDLFMTLHTYGELWMAPWGYTATPPADKDEMIRVGQIGADALEAVHGTRFEVGSASDILYSSSGTSRDWAKGVPDIPYVYTLELRGNSFIMPVSDIIPAGEETWAGFKAAVLAFQ